MIWRSPDAFRLISDAWSSAWTLPFRDEIYEYGRKINLSTGYGWQGKFDVNRSKYLIDVFHCLKNPRVRMEVTLKAVRTGGTLCDEIHVPFIIEHDRGDILWLVQDDDFAKTFAESRFMPMLESIAEIAAMIKEQNRDKKQKTRLYLPGMSLIIGGLNEGNVQGLGFRYVKVDEAWRAKTGLLLQAKARTKDHLHNSNFHVTSQAGVEGDDLDVLWKQTDQREWFWKCWHCGAVQPYYWNERRDDNSWCGVIWDTNEKTCPDGKWKMSEVLKTIRMACKFCTNIITDTPRERLRLNDSSLYVPQNPDALPENTGHHWNILAKPDVPFAEIVVEYLDAKHQAEEFGLKVPLQLFYQKNLAKPWSLNTDAGVTILRSDDYDAAEKWKDELYRFMTVDVQKDFTEFYVIIRAWSKDGASRQLCRRKVESWDQVAKIQQEFHVADGNVFPDIGFEQTKVARVCASHGHIQLVKARREWACWTGMKGSDYDTFTHTVPRIDAKGKIMRDRTPDNFGRPLTRKEERIYSAVDYLDPNIGQGSRLRPVPYYTWSNLHVKDILKRHRDGQAGKWDILPDADPLDDKTSFSNQMQAEICLREKDKNGRRKRRWVPVSTRRPNHWWDCEAMQIVAACIAGIIGGSEPAAAAEPDVKELPDGEERGKGSAA